MAERFPISLQESDSWEWLIHYEIVVEVQLGILVLKFHFRIGADFSAYSFTQYFWDYAAALS